MRHYKGRTYTKPTGGVPTASIRATEGNVLLRLPHAAQYSRVNLALDERTFNIQVQANGKGLLKCWGTPSGARLVSLRGFLKENDLSYEDVRGKYNIQWIQKPRQFLLLYHTRRKHPIKSRDNRKKITVVISKEELGIWSKNRGSLSMSTFVRSAVNRYIEDYKL